MNDEKQQPRINEDIAVQASRGPKLSRRGFVGVLTAVGVTTALAGWGISQTKLKWQIGEFLALASLGGKSQKANKAGYAGSEAKVAFGDHPQQYVLVFPPLKSAPPRDSVVFFTYGGGWSMGNPELYRFVGRFFAERGYPTILAGYRLTPDYRFPSQMEDVSASLRAGLDYLEKANVPTKRVVLGGHSAGSQLASLLAYDHQTMQVQRPMFSGFFSMSGPLDFSLDRSGSIRKMLDAYVGHLPNPEIADPIQYASPDVPISALLLHGAHDPVVDPENSRSFAEKLNQGAVKRAQLYIVPDTYHSDILNLFLDESGKTKILTEWLAEVDKS